MLGCLRELFTVAGARGAFPVTTFWTDLLAAVITNFERIGIESFGGDGRTDVTAMPRLESGGQLICCQVYAAAAFHSAHVDTRRTQIDAGTAEPQPELSLLANPTVAHRVLATAAGG